MILLHVDAESYARLKAHDADDYSGQMDDPVYMWKRIDWYERNGAGFFLCFCCGVARVPDGLMPGPDAADVAERNVRE